MISAKEVTEHTEAPTILRKSFLEMQCARRNLKAVEELSKQIRMLQQNENKVYKQRGVRTRHGENAQR